MAEERFVRRSVPWGLIRRGWHGGDTEAWYATAAVYVQKDIGTIVTMLRNVADAAAISVCEANTAEA